MSQIVSVPSGTGDVASVTGNSTLVGVAVTATVAPATVNVRHGDGATDPLIASVTLAAVGGTTLLLPAVECPDGIFVDRVAGTTELGLLIL